MSSVDNIVYCWRVVHECLAYSFGLNIYCDRTTRQVSVAAVNFIVCVHVMFCYFAERVCTARNFPICAQQTRLTLKFGSCMKFGSWSSSKCITRYKILNRSSPAERRHPLIHYIRMMTVVIMNIGTLIMNDDYSRHGHHWLNSAAILQGYVQLPNPAYDDKRVYGPLLLWVNGQLQALPLSTLLHTWDFSFPNLL